MKLLTIGEVCGLLHCCRRTLEYALARGDIPAPRRIGSMRKRYWVEDEIEKFIRKTISDALRPKS